MATVLSKTFDVPHGAVIINVQDAIVGNVSVHTAYVTGLNAVTDINAWIAQTCANVDAAATALHAAFTAAGWTPNGN